MDRAGCRAGTGGADGGRRSARPVALAAARGAESLHALERLVRAYRRHAAEALRGAVRQPRRAAPRGTGRPRRGAGADGDVEVADRRRAAAGAGRKLSGGKGSVLAGVSATLAGTSRLAAVPRMAAGRGGRLPSADVGVSARRHGGRLMRFRYHGGRRALSCNLMPSVPPPAPPPAHAGDTKMD